MLLREGDGSDSARGLDHSVGALRVLERPVGSNRRRPSGKVAHQKPAMRAACSAAGRGGSQQRAREGRRHTACERVRRVEHLTAPSSGYVCRHSTQPRLCLQTQHPATGYVCRHSTCKHLATAYVCRHSTWPKVPSAALADSAPCAVCALGRHVHVKNRTCILRYEERTGPWNGRKAVQTSPHDSL